MSASSNVTAGNDALASDYNKLRYDAISSTASHGHTGATGDGKKLAIKPLLAAGYVSVVLSANNATESSLNTISIASGETAGDIFLDVICQPYGSTTTRHWISNIVTSGVSCVNQTYTGIYGNFAVAPTTGSSTSYYLLDGVGTNKRGVTVSVDSITADGNDVVLKLETTIGGTPGTGKSTVSLNYQIFSA